MRLIRTRLELYGSLIVRSACVLLTASLLLIVGVQGTAEPDFAQMILATAQEIAGLKERFPELRDFSPTKNVHVLSIDYAYHTHKARHRGGWTAGVPNPNDDGLWFYIDFHDPDSVAQIHTQPMTGPANCLGRKRVSFLTLAGKKTRPVGSELWSILQKYGVKKCDDLQNPATRSEPGS